MTKPNDLKRREFLKGVAAASAASTAAQSTSQAGAENGPIPGSTPASTKVFESSVTLKINGRQYEKVVDTRTTLVDLLREDMQMFGTKKGCDHGACGACTVHVNGRRVLSCLTLVATLDGADVRTIEGVASEGALHPMQESFLRCDAYQCGYCTPGQIMSAIACIDEGHVGASAEETREWMSGNLCRCSAYPNILAAVRQTAGVEPEVDPTDATLEASR